MAALVQQATGSGSGTSFTVTLGSAPLAGSVLVLKFRDEVHTGVSVSGGGATRGAGIAAAATPVVRSCDGNRALMSPPGPTC